MGAPESRLLRQLENLAGGWRRRFNGNNSKCSLCEVHFVPVDSSDNISSAFPFCTQNRHTALGFATSSGVSDSINLHLSRIALYLVRTYHPLSPLGFIRCSRLSRDRGVRLKRGERNRGAAGRAAVRGVASYSVGVQRGKLHQPRRVLSYQVAE